MDTSLSEANNLTTEYAPPPSWIREYKRSDCVVFRKTNEQFGGLSNMAPGFPLTLKGFGIIRTSEALYQTCRFPDRPDIQRMILAETSPMTAKMKSKPFRKHTRPDWLLVRANIMRWCIRVKLFCNFPKFQQLLNTTGTRPIVEESRKDQFWGAIADAADHSQLVGANVMGRLLMEVRAELIDINDLRILPPPPIPGLLLLGVPIPGVEMLRDPPSYENLDRDLFSHQWDRPTSHNSQ